MSMNSLPEHEGLLDLLAERSGAGLEDHAEQSLSALLAEHSGDGVGADAFDEAAAAFAVVFAEHEGVEAMPVTVRRSLSAAAAAYTADDDGSAPPTFELKPVTGAETGYTSLQREGRVPVLAWGGWLAAAASLLIAVLITAPQREMTAQQQLQLLLASAADAVESNWVGLADLGLAEANHRYDNGITGRVVWAEGTDEGFMEIAGLEVNDPTEEQYQLWIFDAARPEGEYPGAEGLMSQRPIDGGVFDFTPGPDGRAIIPIDPKLRVEHAALFAVTLEPPGGVVVSDRDVVFAAPCPDPGYEPG